MNKNLLISVAGSQGTGKSTLLNQLRSAYDTSDVHFVSRKTSRSILEEWNVTLDEINRSTELSINFQDTILHRKLIDDIHSRDTKKGISFTERTPVDFFVYALVNMGKHNDHSDWVNQYYEQCKRACSHYDIVFYLPSNKFEIENDGVRGSNKHYASMIDALMSKYYEQMIPSDRLYEIKSVDISNRVQEVKDIINKE